MSTREEQDGSLYPDVIIEGHDYDGIEEYDNPMPGWWLWIFYATIIWSVFYVAALGVGWIDGYDEQLTKEMRNLEETRQAAAALVTPMDEELLLAAMNDPAAIQAGQQAYSVFCVACHGADHSGGIGPSLVDGNWVHGDSPMEIYQVILDGVGAAGMPAHPHLSEEQLVGLVAYIKTL